ncbi:MAG: polynucleotide adenylyltransferase PcnB [Spirochaetaceae bacterium]|nr:polynucleotide adenylyltransferase PcnB [Spirochaetaceae bacterium]
MRVRYAAEKDGKPVKKAIVYTQDEHGIAYADVDPEAVTIVSRLRSQGFETYIVGGAVRDLILGKKPKDFDIVSEANPSKIKKLFYNARIIGHRFRLVHVYFGEKRYEVATFRSLKDGLTGNTFGTIEEDVLRRDFSINALFYDPLGQIVVDYVNGMQDIRKKNLRPLIPLPKIFTDDPVRIIRAVKFSTTTGFKLSLPLKWMIKKQGSLLRDTSPSRLTEEIFKILNAPLAGEIVDNLDALGVYAYLQPSAAELMKKKEFRERYIKNFALNAEASPLPGAELAPLIRTYLEDEAARGNLRWDSDPDHYKNIFAAARRFILPMSPPKIDLDRALRLLFEEHGIVIKKVRFLDRERHEKRENPELPPDQIAESQKRQKTRKRKNSKKEKTEAITATEKNANIEEKFEEKEEKTDRKEKTKKRRPRRRRSRKPKDETV